METGSGKQVLYKDLSYRLVGCLYEVYNRLGFGYQEKVYQKALGEELGRQNLPFKRESFSRVTYKGATVGYYYQDFVVDGKIVIELKVGDGIYQRNVNQLLSYLKNKNLRLGVIAVFTRKGVLIRRVLN